MVLETLTFVNYNKPNRFITTMKQKKFYSTPEIKVREVKMEQTLLALSAKGIGLSGAGVDESNADLDGINKW